VVVVQVILEDPELAMVVLVDQHLVVQVVLVPAVAQVVLVEV
jgi:hypothetical protein